MADVIADRFVVTKLETLDRRRVAFGAGRTADHFNPPLEIAQIEALMFGFKQPFVHRGTALN